MPGYEKTTNFLTSFFIYSIAAIVIMAAGFKVVQYSTRLKFYTRYLLKWEQALTQLTAKDTMGPKFTGSNHVLYMEQMIQHMQTHGIPIPESNTGKPYVYRIPKQGLTEKQDIFLLCLEQKIVLFGLSKPTFDMLDKKIDNKLDENHGTFTGKQQQDNEDYTAIWKL
ncbi:MAG: hypothetical protein ABIJ31_01095 [Pseudomonadota bacterium]